jgi:hypothetical protein
VNQLRLWHLKRCRHTTYMFHLFKVDSVAILFYFYDFSSFFVTFEQINK